MSEQASRIIERALPRVSLGEALQASADTYSPSLYSASYLLSMITASLAVDLTWLPVEICVKE
jgi:hypothetical protein